MKQIGYMWNTLDKMQMRKWANTQSLVNDENLQQSYIINTKPYIIEPSFRF
jgi:hypothetical protein